METFVSELDSLSVKEKAMINNICNVAFNQDLNRNYVEMVQRPGTTVSLIRYNGVIGGVAFLDHVKSNVDPIYSSPNYSHVHSIAIAPEFRGRGLCKELVKPLVKKYGHNPMYLHVRTKLGDPNVSAIKCYRRNGFVIIPTVNEERQDGPNSLMVRMGPKKRKTKKKRKKTTRKYRKSKV